MSAILTSRVVNSRIEQPILSILESALSLGIPSLRIAQIPTSHETCKLILCIYMCVCLLLLC